MGDRFSASTRGQTKLERRTSFLEGRSKVLREGPGDYAPQKVTDNYATNSAVGHHAAEAENRCDGWRYLGLRGLDKQLAGALLGVTSKGYSADAMDGTVLGASESQLVTVTLAS